jgi:hypothetical protein
MPLSVDFTPVANFYYQYNEFVVLNAEYDPVTADSYPIQVMLGFKLDDARVSRVLSQACNFYSNTLS